jgi:exo-beta-1,3-glucanase (GH17 family)
MKTTLLSLLALGASTVSAFPSTLIGHKHQHLHAPAKRAASSWSDGNSRSYGIAYDLMGDGGCRPASQVQSEVGELVGQGYTQIRTYDIGCDVGVLANAISAHPGVKLFAGLNTIANLQGDLQKLIGFLQPYFYLVETINIGNELVNAGISDAGSVAAAVGTARGILQAAGYTGNVVTVDTFVAHLANPGLCAASDYCAANIYAFFDGNVGSSDAGGFVQRMKSAVAGIAGGKEVRVTESGWSSCGGNIGAAVADPANKAAAIASIKGAFAADQSDVFIFQAFDATYKAAISGAREACFGVNGS